jgi:hypothetical protein
MHPLDNWSDASTDYFLRSWPSSHSITMAGTVLTNDSWMQLGTWELSSCAVFWTQTKAGTLMSSYVSNWACNRSWAHLIAMVTVIRVILTDLPVLLCSNWVLDGLCIICNGVVYTLGLRKKDESAPLKMNELHDCPSITHHSTIRSRFKNA